MKRKTHLIMAAIIILIGFTFHLVFEIFAPYCAKNICGQTSGSEWMLLYVFVLLMYLIGSFYLFENVILYREP